MVRLWRYNSWSDVWGVFLLFPIFLGLLSIVVFVWGASSLASYFYRRAEKAAPQISLLSRVAVLVAGAICIGLCLFGIRGRMGYNPIKVSQAYYCEDPFLNQLGVNPVFNLLTSTLMITGKKTGLCI